ncbi:MAG: hypothetical protein RL108_1012, partial [Bacteroidota bacterium]
LLFRPLYYFILKGRIVNIEGYHHLKGYKWIINHNYGMAYFKGYYEPLICQILTKHLSVDSVFVDVGGHAGYFSLFAAAISKNGHVFSFEPEPNNYNFMDSILKLNDVANWSIINKAAGQERGQMFFEVGSTSSTGRMSENGKLPVDVTTLNAELSNLERLDIIKIDVEGFGGRVVQGGVEVILKFLPILMIEIHQNSDELETILKYLGEIYLFKDIENGELINSVSQSPHFIIGFPRKHFSIETDNTIS